MMPPMAPITGLEIFYFKLPPCPPPPVDSPGSSRRGGGGRSLRGRRRRGLVGDESSYDGNTIEGIQDGRGLCGGDPEDVEDLVPHNVPDHTQQEIQHELGRESVLFWSELFWAGSLAGQNQHWHWNMATVYQRKYVFHLKKKTTSKIFYFEEPFC